MSGPIYKKHFSDNHFPIRVSKCIHAYMVYHYMSNHNTNANSLYYTTFRYKKFNAQKLTFFEFFEQISIPCLMRWIIQSLIFSFVFKYSCRKIQTPLIVRETSAFLFLCLCFCVLNSFVVNPIRVLQQNQYNKFNYW